MVSACGQSDTAICLSNKIFTTGVVEDTRLEAKAKDTKKSEAKATDSPSEDRPSRGQGQRTQAQVFTKQKKMIFKKFFFRRSPKENKKRSSKFFYWRSPKKDLQKIFSGDLQNFNDSKNSAALEPRTEQFWELEASRLRRGLRTWPSRPKARTSKCVLEAKDVLKDSTAGLYVTCDL